MKDFFKNILRRAQNFEGFIEHSDVSHHAYWNILSPGNNNNQLTFAEPRLLQRSSVVPGNCSLLPPQMSPCSLAFLMFLHSPSMTQLWDFFRCYPLCLDMLFPQRLAWFTASQFQVFSTKKKKLNYPSNLTLCQPCTMLLSYFILFSFTALITI